MKKQSAFTLVELLVVIAIIGLIATLSVIALANARAKSRDSKRVSDIKQVQTALELFFSDQGRYPTATEWNTGSLYATGTFGTTTYMARIPQAPTNSDGSCSNLANPFTYYPSSDGASYGISFCLGNKTGSFLAGDKCIGSSGILNRLCRPIMVTEYGTYTLGEYNGEQYLQASGGLLTAFGSAQAYGDFEFNLYKGADANEIRIYPISTMANLYGSGYWFGMRSSEELRLNSYANGSSAVQMMLTPNSYVANNTWYNIKLSRLSSQGSFPDIGRLNQSIWTQWGTGTWATLDNNTATTIHAVRNLGAGHSSTAMPLVGQKAVNGRMIMVTADINVISKASLVSTYLGTSNGGYQESPNTSSIYLSLGNNHVSQIFVVGEYYDHQTSQLEYAISCNNNCEFSVSNLETYTVYPAGTFASFIKGGSFGNSWTLINTTGGAGTNPVLNNDQTSSAYFTLQMANGDRISGLKLNSEPISFPNP